MTYVSEAGDVVGTEVWIVYGGDGYYATVQLAEGVPMRPKVVPVEVRGTNVKFALGADKDLLIFKGTVTRAGLSGTVNSDLLNLKRKKSYWQ